MIRLPTRHGIPVWIPAGQTQGRYGESVQLYKAIVGGKTVALPKSYIERELQRTAEWEEMGLSKTMRKKMSRAQSWDINKLSEKQFEQFLAKMPNIINGMLALKQQNVKLPPGFERRLKLIVSKLEQLSPEERAEFYFKYADEFNETSDWYKLAQKYGYKPGDIFGLDEKDIQKLKEKGFDTYDEYVQGVYSDLGELNNKLNKYLRTRR